MPARKEVPSLQSLCIQYVSSNLGAWCHGSNVTNPVSCLPGVILNDICTTVMRREKISRCYLNAVIHRFTRHLEFPRNLRIIGRGIKLIRKVCTNIVSINLSNTTLYPSYLFALGQSVPLIQSLNLRSTCATDMVLYHLGENSPDLRELDVGDTDVTDDGIADLCVERVARDGSVRGGRCRLLVRLIVKKTKVTDEGAKTAIKNLPHLRDFDYKNILKVLKNIYKENSVNESDWYKLENITYLVNRNKNFTNFMLDAAIRLCPDVTRFETFLTTGDDECLPRLVNFHRLEELLISGSAFGFGSVIYHQVAVILNTIRSRLKRLTLWHVKDVNLWHIGDTCLQLSRLHLAGNSFISDVPPGGNLLKHIFGELREIKINCRRADVIPPAQLCTMLINCTKLQILNFDYCRSLTDELLLRVFTSNSFSELHTLLIRECDNIHISTILSLIRISESLKLIVCSECAGIRNSEFVELEMLLRAENLDITILYDSLSYRDYINNNDDIYLFM